MKYIFSEETSLSTHSEPLLRAQSAWTVARVRMGSLLARLLSHREGRPSAVSVSREREEEDVNIDIIIDVVVIHSCC